MAASDLCQAKRIGLVTQRCRYFATQTLGDAHPAGLCDRCMKLYWLIVDHNPELADKIRRKVGMRR